MKVLCYGATGVQGSPVAEQLLARGHDVRVVVREPDRLRTLIREKASIIVGGFDEPLELERATQGVDSVFLILPLVYDRKRIDRYFSAALSAARMAGVKRLVFNTSTRIPEQSTDVAAFEIKRELEHRLEDSGVPFISLRPTFYLENLLLPTSLADLDSGILRYPLPSDRSTGWISARDVARFCVSALEGHGPAGSKIDLAGPDMLTGRELADHLGNALGTQIRYQAADIDAFEAMLAQFLGAEVAGEVGNLNRWWRLNPDYEAGFTADIPALRNLLPVEALETPAEWIGRQSWR